MIPSIPIFYRVSRRAVRALKPIRRNAMALAAFVLALAAPALHSHAQGPTPSLTTKPPKQVAPGVAVSYFDGEREVQLVVSLDELAVDAPEGTDLSSRLQRSSTKIQRIEKLAGHTTHRVRFTSQPDRRTLEERAAELAMLVPEGRVYAVLYDPTAAKRSPEQAKILTHQLAVKTKPGVAIAPLATSHNLKVVQKVSYSPDTYILESRTTGLFDALDAANTLQNWGAVEFATPLLRKHQQRRLIPNDPLFSRQWHLRNTGSNPGVTGLVAGNDINVTSAWDTSLGTGVNIAIVDDGLQVAHPDLAPNARTDIDIDINYNDNDPSPDLAGDNHGTACAGVAAARGNNSVGVSGAAPNASLVGVRLISAAATDAQEAQGLTHQLTAANPADRVSIYSNSWGPADDGVTLEGPGPLAKAALQNGVTNGRGGLGAIYTWAGGNGGSSDNANYDGYANNRFTIAVAASGGAGEQSSYSEQGSCIVVNAPSSYSGGGITTVDRTGSDGYEDPPGDYTYTFGGTSSACPLVAGSVAVLLQAYPSLTWRDVLDILIRSATKNSPSDTSWFTNGAGLNFSHKFGFGRVNVANALALAATHVPMPPEATPLSASETLSPALAIPDNNATGITRSLTISGPANFKIEYAAVTVSITHPYRGDLEMFLTSPAGTISKIATTRYDSGDNYNNWTFTSVVHWGESPNGTWSFKVADRFSADTGTLNSWTLTLYGHLENPARVGDWMLY